MAASDLTKVAYIYKSRYSDDKVQDVAERDHPTYKMIRKVGGFTGTDFKYAIRYGNPQGGSGTFADAQGAATGSKGVQMTAVRKRKYWFYTLDGEAMAAADGDAGSFLTLVRQESEGSMEEMGDTIAFDLFRAGNGQRGRRSSETGNVVTLTQKHDARNFKVGMKVIASANADGSSPRTGSAVLTAVMHSSGKIKANGAGTAFSDITSFADNDYLFRKGDPGTCAEGFEKHFPLAEPVEGTDSFRGVDRGVHPELLAGARLDESDTVVEECIGSVSVSIASNGRKANYAPLHPVKFWEVARRCNAKVTYDGGGMKASIGFQGFDINTPAGVVRCVSEPDAPLTLGYVLNMKSLYVKHLRGLPHVVDDDGRPSLRSTSEDSIEARLRSWHNLLCTAPADNGVYSIAA